MLQRDGNNLYNLKILGTGTYVSEQTVQMMIRLEIRARLFKTNDFIS